VAIIDDDASVRRSLLRALNANGIRALAFGSAEEYLRVGSASRPLCIIADVQLGGGMTGLELVNRLASEPGAPAAILMTGHELPHALMGLDDACARWLRKPFEAARLLALLAPYIDDACPPEDLLPRTGPTPRPTVFGSP
jgi:FixJ family two-component response regulator